MVVLVGWSARFGSTHKDYHSRSTVSWRGAANVLKMQRGVLILKLYAEIDGPICTVQVATVPVSGSAVPRCLIADAQTDVPCLRVSLVATSS